MSVLEGARAATAGNGSMASRPRRAARARLSRAQWLALILGALAALVNVAAIRDRRDVASVAVADEVIAPATVVTREMVRFVDVPADSPLVEGLVNDASFDTGVAVATRLIPEGEPLSTAALADDVPSNGLRSMSVPVARERAAGGALRPGDRVDVIDVSNEEPAWVVSGVEVLAVEGETAGSVGAPPGQFSVTLAVDSAGALRLAAALADEQVDVIRATGAAPVNTAAVGVGVG